MSIETKVVITCNKCKAQVEFPSEEYAFPKGWFEVHRTNEPRARVEVRQLCEKCLDTLTFNEVFGKPETKKRKR